MKQLKLIPFFVLLLSVFSIAAQNIQGTILPGPTPNSVYITIRPTANLTGSITDFQFAIAIPVSAAATTPPYTLTSLITNLTVSPSARLLTTQSVGGVNSYVYTFSAAGTGVASATFTSGVHYNIMQVSFGGSIPFPTTTVQLVQLPNGGSNGQSNFFVAFSNILDATHPTLPFFGTGAVNDGLGYAGYSYVPLSNVVLPVKFLGFNATKKDNNALLSWQIENESATTDRYEIERSLNGVDYVKFATVLPKNNGRTGNSYDLSDLNLSGLRSSGVFYYRIKQVDKDGKFIYSEIKNLRLNSKGLTIAVYPNPVRSFANLTIDVEQDEDATLIISDASGKQVQLLQLQLFKGPNIKKIKMDNLAGGSYMLKVQTATELKTMAVVKAN